MLDPRPRSRRRRGREGFTHLDDLYAVLDATVDGPAWLVGNSMAGALALDAAVSAPERIAGPALIAPAVSGQPDEGFAVATCGDIAEQIPAARLELVPGVAHLPMPEIPERIAALIQASTSGR